MESFLFFNNILKDNFIMRKEYMAVIVIDEIINKDIICINVDLIIISKIISLEKNPDIKGSPIKAIKEIPIVEEMIGELFIIVPMWRISWYDEFMIIIPAAINIIDLNRAWVIRWKKAKLGFIKEIANIIIAIWLRVENAIIFFISGSQHAVILA